MSTIPLLPRAFGSDDLSRILLDLLQRKSEDSDNEEASLVFKRAHHLLQCQGCAHVLCTGYRQINSVGNSSANNNNASRIASEKNSNLAKCDNANETDVVSERAESLKTLNELSTSNHDSKNVSSENKMDAVELSKSEDKKRMLDKNKNSNNVQKKIKLDASNNVQKRIQQQIIDSPRPTGVDANFWTPPSKIDLLTPTLSTRTPPAERISSKESGKMFMFHGRLVSRKDPPIDIPWESLSPLDNDPRLVNHVGDTTSCSQVKEMISYGGTVDDESTSTMIEVEGNNDSDIATLKHV